MHNLKIEIDEILKKQVYKYAGFKFSNSTFLDQELNYEKIFNAIDPGGEFKRLCNDLELDTEVAAQYIKKYVLHLIIQDVIINLKYPSKKTLMKLTGQEILGQKIEDIIDEIFFNTPRDLFNQLSYIEGFFTSGQIEHKLENEYNWTSFDENALMPESREKWKKNSKKVGSFYPLYVKYAPRKSRLAQSLVKPFNKITDFNQELINKQLHFNRFIKALEQVEYNTSQDVWLFEYNTFYLMLRKIGLYENLEDVDEKYFPVLASFLFVGDIRFKLLLIDELFKSESLPHYKNKLSDLFLLSLVIVPFFKEYVKNKLVELISEDLPDYYRRVEDDHAEMKVENLKKQLHIYQILKTQNYYRGEDLLSEFGIDIKSELKVTKGLKIAWKHIEQASGRINKNYNIIFQGFLNHIREFESLSDSNDQEELTKTFKIWLESGIFKTTQEYKNNIIEKNNNSSETIDLSDFNFIGKIDDERQKIRSKVEGHRHMKQKKLNKNIGEEMAQLGIDVNKLKEISAKYNCSITVEPHKIINKTIS
ncbi:hypothetical protein LCM10_18510 [Rossellomorea aquimaris]|uniref:hypothetical protein n=1 Tax=Rossellomorea aquimaris TaxID=189382 RepID=UPI001CD5D1CC|nr:hypothetical protein [Rossellomorea aquimaris]MCA1056959.1 hypothetical protein [Rossellomorea aquimaris]